MCISYSCVWSGCRGLREPDDVAGPVPRQLLGPEQGAAAGDVGLEAEPALTRFPGRVEHEGDLGQLVPGGDDAAVLDRLGGVAVEHEHGAEVVDVPAVVVGVGLATAALELGRDLLGEQPLRFLDPALGGPVPPAEPGVGQPPLAHGVGGHAAGLLVQRQRGEDRGAHLLGQPPREGPKLTAELLVRLAGVAAGQLEQDRADLPGYVTAERAVLAERLNLRCNLSQARQIAPSGGRCHLIVTFSGHCPIMGLFRRLDRDHDGHEPLAARLRPCLGRGRSPGTGRPIRGRSG